MINEKLNVFKVGDLLKDKRILITGVCGTVGSKILEILITKEKEYAQAEIVGLDNNESELFFKDQEYLNNPKVSFFVCDIRDKDNLKRMMKGVDIVYHVAALKHVVMCERSPIEAVQSNILGVQNVITAAKENNIERVIFTSSDKAVNPTSVMGTSKLMGERLMTAANSISRSGTTIFSSTRFGNVLGSRGSVVSIFHRQIATGGPVTLTDELMTRFVMSVEEAAGLVISSSMYAKGGEVFVTKMPVLVIRDLAEVMIQELAPLYGQDPSQIEIVLIGSKSGEKIFEELMSDEETRRAIELDRFFSILPAFRGLYRDISYQYESVIESQVNDAYISSNQTPLSRNEIRDLLFEYDLLMPEAVSEHHPDARYWPGDHE